MNKIMKHTFIVSALFSVMVMSSCKKDEVPPPDNNNNNNTNSNLYFGLDTSYHLNTLNFNSYSSGSFPGSVNYMITANDNSVLITLTTGHIYRSTDNGDNWIQIINAPGNTYSANLAKGPDGKIYAGIPGNGLYISSDNGASFNPATATGLNLPSTQLGIHLSISPNNTIFAYLLFGPGNDALFASNDGGVSFLPVALPNTGNFLNADGPYLWHDNANNMFIADETGLFRSNDDGATWTNIYPIQNMYSVFVAPDGRIFMHDNLFTKYISTDAGNTFTSQYVWGNHVRKVYGVLPNGNYIGVAGASNSGNEFVFRSTDNGMTWLSMGKQFGAPDEMTITSTGVLACVGGTTQINWDQNETFWTCKNLPNLTDWKDFDLEGDNIVVAANQQMFYSNNYGRSWIIGEYIPWNIFSVDLNAAIGKIAVGVGVYSGSPLNGTVYILDAQATSILSTVNTTTGMNVYDVVLADDDSWVLALGWEPANHGFIAATVDGGQSYQVAEESFLGEFPRTLFYDTWANNMICANWDEANFTGWGYNIYNYTPGSGLGTASPFSPTSRYFATSWSRSWARNFNTERLFMSVHSLNQVWYQDQQHWMWKYDYLNLPNQVERMKFDDAGYLWVITSNGLYRSDVLPAISY